MTMEHDDLFALIMIDKRRKIKVIVELQDSEGDVVSIPETLEQLTDYMKDQMEYDADASADDIGAIPKQILPLMGQSVGHILPALIGEAQALILLSSEVSRHALTSSMTLAFLMLKFIQQHDLKIFTTEESISDEEIEELIEASRIRETATMGAIFGLSPQEILKNMVDNGDISSHELSEALEDQYWSEEKEEDDDKDD